MDEVHAIPNPSSERLRGRDRRSQNLSTKLTEAEAKATQDAAARTEKTSSEWAREVLLREAGGVGVNFDLICEVVGLQLLLMNVLAPMARGERITAEQFQGIVKSVQTAKVKAAGEMLSRRRQPKEA
jgi:hypothetical protein